MPKFRNTITQEIVDAEQWFKNGDHSEDNCETFISTGTSSNSLDIPLDGTSSNILLEGTCINEDFLPKGTSFQGEGKVVRYFRRPDIDGSIICIMCQHTLHEHGWLDSPTQYCERVCPGDWIVKENGAFNAYHPFSFTLKYVPLELAKYKASISTNIGFTNTEPSKEILKIVEDLGEQTEHYMKTPHIPSRLTKCITQLKKLWYKIKLLINSKKIISNQ